jgi:hypothetical protein
MSKDGLGRSGWAMVFLVGGVALWATIEYVFLNTKLSFRDEVWIAFLILWVWSRERLEEQDKRLEEIESRIEELENHP